MKLAPLMVMLEALLGLVEQRLRSSSGASRAELLLIGKQLHRLNGLYIGLVESMVAEGGRLLPPEEDRPF